MQSASNTTSAAGQGITHVLTAGYQTHQFLRIAKQMYLRLRLSLSIWWRMSYCMVKSSVWACFRRHTSVSCQQIMWKPPPVEAHPEGIPDVELHKAKHANEPERVSIKCTRNAAIQLAEDSTDADMKALYDAASALRPAMVIQWISLLCGWRTSSKGTIQLLPLGDPRAKHNTFQSCQIFSCEQERNQFGPDQNDYSSKP